MNKFIFILILFLYLTNCNKNAGKINEEKNDTLLSSMPFKSDYKKKIVSEPFTQDSLTSFDISDIKEFNDKIYVFGKKIVSEKIEETFHLKTVSESRCALIFDINAKLLATTPIEENINLTLALNQDKLVTLGYDNIEIRNKDLKVTKSKPLERKMTNALVKINDNQFVRVTKEDKVEFEIWNSNLEIVNKTVINKTFFNQFFVI